MTIIQKTTSRFASAVACALLMASSVYADSISSDATYTNTTHTKAAPLYEPTVLVQGYVAQKSVIPRYPETAIKKCQEGRVTIQFRVDQRGIAKDFHILRASSVSAFERSAIAAIKASRFKPIAMRVSQTIIFSLTGETNPVPKPSVVGKNILTARYERDREE